MLHLSNGTLLSGGRYKIVRFISAGGFGCTYEAEFVTFGERVAIKEFFVKDFCNRNEETSEVTVGITSRTALVNKLKKKFVDEARSIRKLEHPNIVKVSDVFEENGTAYYVMDYIDGPSLNDIVKQSGAMSEAQALKYIRQVSDALQYVHSKNRLHLDIKPGNIMVDPKDNAVLIDFGTSKQYDEEAGENTSTLLGKTPGYAPLEQMGNDVVQFTPATDIYSLGASLYRMLTGVTPPSALLIASGQELKELPSSVSSATRNAVKSAMQINKNNRPQTIADFLAILNGSESRDDQTIPYDEETSVIVRETPVEESMPEPKVVEAEPIVENPDVKAQSKKRKIKKWAVVIASIMVVFTIIETIPFLISSETQEKETVEAETQPKEYATNATFQDAKGRDFTYTGQIERALPNGEGVGIYDYGTYTGEYRDGKREGNGKFNSKDGTQTFEGTFANDEYKEGTITLDGGSKFKGTFQNGQPYNGKWYNADGSFNADVVNGGKPTGSKQQQATSKNNNTQKDTKEKPGNKSQDVKQKAEDNKKKTNNKLQNITGKNQPENLPSETTDFMMKE